MKMITRRWLTRAEAAAYMGVSPRTIDRWANARLITRHRVAGVRSVRYSQAELDKVVRP